MAHFYPQLTCLNIRGNLNTRLAKLGAEESPYSCLVLAAAGLKRLGLESRISQVLDVGDGILFAPGQGALGLEIREGDAEMQMLVDGLADQSTTLACVAERQLLKTLEGGCSAPIGTASCWRGEVLELRAQVISADGTEIVEDEVEGSVESQGEAERLGEELARKLMVCGAGAILEGTRRG